MRIKICGLRRVEDVEYVNKTSPDYVGFVFAGKKRKISFEMAKDLKQRLNKEIPVVGVFVNEDIKNICELVFENIIDVIQLHGDEDEEYVANLKTNLKQKSKENVTIIKAVRVENQKQVEDAEKYDVDYLLLDAFKEDEYGGSGKVFDHNLIPKLSKPYFLAGGISVDNVEDIISLLKEKNILPYCIDVSSSVETDGFKDEKKIGAIVDLVKSL